MTTTTTMTGTRSNEEKLVHHIFDRTNWIIQQVKQQTYLYQQYLACNLLIQGINPPPPPPCFLNPNSHLPQEINKQELISDLLLPHARPAFPYSTGQCYLQSRLVVTGKNVLSLVEFPKDIHEDHDTNNSLGGGDKLKLVHESHDYDDGYNSNCIPRRSCTSSHDREDARVANISNKSTHSGQSQGGSQIYQQADGSLLEVNASNKSLGGGIEPMDLPDNHDADFGCIPNSVPKCTPANQNVARISDLDIAPDQSLVRFQRSKSRQKALELRTNAKATKSHFSNDNKTISFSGVALYGIDVEEPDHSKDLLVMEKSSEMNKKSSVERVSSTDLSSKSGTSNNCGRITRSKSNCKRQSSFSEPSKLDVSHENVRKDSGKESCVMKRAKGRHQGMENGAGGSCGQITRSKSSCIQHICLNESLETGRSSTIQFENGEELFQCMDNDNLLVSKEMEVVIPFHAMESSKYLNVVTRSIDSRRQPGSMDDSVDDAVGLGAASYIPKVGGSSCDEFSGKLNPPLDKGTEVQEVVQPLTELDGNMNKSEKTCRNEGLVLSVKSSSIADLKDTHSRSFATEEYPLLCSSNMPDGSGHKGLSDSPLVSSLNMLDGSGHKDLSDSKVILPVTKTSATLNKETVPSAMAIELDGHPRCFRSTLDNANLRTESEVVSVRLASDAVQPKQLHFDGLEDYRLNEHYIPSSVMKSPEQSSRRRCRKLLEPEASLEKSKSDYPSKKQLLGKSGASKGKNKAQRPFETNIEDCNENERTSQPYPNESPQVKHDEDDLKAGLYIFYSPTEKDVSPSVLHEISYLDVRDPNCHVMEGCPEQCIDKGHFSCERWTRSEIVPQTSQQEHSGSSVVPCLIKLATEDSKSCLDKDENLKNKLDYVLDARRDFRVDDEKNVLQHQHNFGCKNINNLVGTEKIDLVEGCFNLIEEGLSISGSVGDPHDEDNNFGSLGFGETQPTYTSSLSKNRSRHKKADSWPQSKRRMIEDQQTNCFSASPSFRVQRLHDIQVAHSEDVFYAGSKLPAVYSSHEQNFSWRSDLFNEKMECLLIDETLSSPMFRRQQVEGEIGFEEQIKVGETPSVSEHEKLGQCFLSSLSKQANKDLQGFFVEDYTSYLAANNLREEHKFQKIFHVGNADDLADGDILTSTKSALIDSNSLLKEGNPVGSPCNKELAFDQNSRVNEGCVLNERSDNEELDSSINGIDFGELNTTRTSIQRASILEQICRTASMCTPLSQFSSTYKPLKNEDLSASLPNELLEHTNLTCTLPLGDDAGNQLQATSTDEADFALRAMLSSDCLPYSGARYGWNSKNYDTPPAGKYCERIPSKSMSSEKLLGSNPELTCFPIEEDPIVDDENENADEDDGSIQEDVAFAEINNCAIGDALLRTEKVLPNPPASISQIEKFHHIGDLHSSNAEVLSSVKQRLRNYCSNRKSQNRGKENQLSSVGSNSIEKVSESLQNRFNKEKLSSTSSIKRGAQRLSEKVKRNNIVSNVTSFIPLVQQKQAAAVCKGKRDIKVRALEAAEAAKRLEEKKENERKIKKEALQLERAKIEQETLRQRELDKRKKEEELKKKDADIAARKRLREEEGRKEKERKRKRIGGGSQNHRAQGGKIFAGKVERDKQFGNKGIQTNRKESSHRIGKDQSVDILSGKGNSLKKSESQTESKITGCNILRVGTVSENCEIRSDCDGSRKLTSMFNQLPLRSGVATKTSHEKSYEMSPYQHSDDEDEEEDEFPPNKFIPSWASRNYVALVLRSQQIDPSVIFPRESFCRIDEVVLPRHLH